MSSKREMVIQGVVALVQAALPACTVERNQESAEELGVEGLVIVRDGDPGEPEIDLSPLAYNYEHRLDLELAALATDTQTREEVLDGYLVAIGAAVAADRTLGGLCDFLDTEAPTTEELQVVGAVPGRWANAAIVASYATSTPLT